MFCPPHKIRPMAETDDQPTVTSDSPSSTHRQPGCLKTFWNSKAVKIFRLVLLPLGLYLSDVITDLILAAQYKNSGDLIWYALTLGFVLGPSVIINIFFLATAVNNGDSILIILIKLLALFLHLGAFPAYFNILYLLLKGKDVEVNVETYLPVTHLIEAMLESIPQLCLQLYIIISTGEQVNVLKVITMVISLLAAVKAVVTCWYYDINEANRTFSCGFVTRLILLTVWKVVELSTRVLTVGFFAHAFKPWVAFPIAVHWLIMTVIQGMSGRSYRMRLLAPLLMAVDTFSIVFSINNKCTFWSNYVLTLLGNITMMTVGFMLKTELDWYDAPAMQGVLVGSLVSNMLGFIAFMLKQYENDDDRVHSDSPRGILNICNCNQFE